ncbi:hypothetical protein D3C81_1146290 [compost metagenome]
MLDLNQINDRSPSGRSSELWDLIGFKTISLAPVRKEHQIMVGVCNEQMLHKVIILGIHTNYATTTPLLTAIRCNRQTFNVTSMCNGNNDFLLWNQIFVQNTLFTDCNFCTALIGEFLTNLIQFCTNNLQDECFITQNFTIFSNLLK